MASSYRACLTLGPKREELREMARVEESPFGENRRPREQCAVRSWCSSRGRSQEKKCPDLVLLLPFDILLVCVWLTKPNWTPEDKGAFSYALYGQLPSHKAGWAGVASILERRMGGSLGNKFDCFIN